MDFEPASFLSCMFSIKIIFSFLVFGPDKLPGMGRTLGRALRQFRNAQEGFNKVVQSDLLDPAADALNEKPKRSEKLRSAASDDSDLDSDAPKQETFAERRARPQGGGHCRRLHARHTDRRSG